MDVDVVNHARMVAEDWAPSAIWLVLFDHNLYHVMYVVKLSKEI
jgi:hypothetical protein